MELANNPKPKTLSVSIPERWWNPPEWKQADANADIADSRYRVESLIAHQIERRLGQQIVQERFELTNLYAQENVVATIYLFDPADSEEVDRLRQYARTLQALDYATIPAYLDGFEIETPLGPAFTIVQKAVEARSLQDWIAAGYCFDESELMRIAGSVLSTLQYLHKTSPNMVHRAIKPGNILLADRRLEDPLVAYEPPQERRDSARIQRGFGPLYLTSPKRAPAANSSGTLTLDGTYGYTAPEQFYGRACPASDLYGLGATLIYLASGKPPAIRVQTNLQIETHGLPLSRPFVEWIGRLTQADTAKRTRSAAQALQELELLQVMGKPLTDSDCNLSVTRPKMAPVPQTVYADFKVQSTEQELKIHFAYDRVRGSSVREQLVAKMTRFDGSATRTAVFVLLTILLVGGSVAYTGSIYLGVLIAVLLPGCFWLATPPLPERTEVTKIPRRASIRLRREDDGRMRLSLSTTPQPRNSRQSTFLESQILLANLPVRSLSTKPGLFSQQISFTLTTHDPRRPKKIAILGSQEEIRWLRVHIGRWLKK